jgi:hypothetical protein
MKKIRLGFTRGYIVKMAYTCLQTFICHTKINCSKVAIRSYTTAKACYYFGKEDDRVIEYSVALLMKEIKNNAFASLFSMHVQCKTIESFELKLGDYAWRIDFTEEL